MKMKPPKMLIIFLCIYFPITAACFMLMFSGEVSTFISGFAVDSSGKLYIGQETKIEVYENNVIQYTISPKTSRGYAFTIQNDDTILLSTASTVYTMDLQGYVLRQEEDVHTYTFNQLQKNKKTFIAKNGDKYILKSNWGRSEIVYYNNGVAKVIYRMPILDYVVKVLNTILYFSLFIFIPVILIKWRKNLSRYTGTNDCTPLH